MNKRISDKKLNELLSRKKTDMYVLKHEDFIGLIHDLREARETVKTIETYGAMFKKEKPSLREYLQKLANKHKMCFALNQLQTLVVYDRGVLSIVNAEEFFGFKKSDFTCDIEVNDVIYPEETEKKKEETSLLYKTIKELELNQDKINLTAAGAIGAPLFVWDDQGEWKLLDGHQVSEISATFEIEGKSEINISVDYDTDIKAYRRLQYLIEKATGSTPGVR